MNGGGREGRIEIEGERKNKKTICVYIYIHAYLHEYIKKNRERWGKINGKLWV